MPRKSPKVLGEKFEEFFDYAICVAIFGNTLMEDQHNFLEETQP